MSRDERTAPASIEHRGAVPMLRADHHPDRHAEARAGRRPGRPAAVVAGLAALAVLTTAGVVGIALRPWAGRSTVSADLGAVSSGGPAVPPPLPVAPGEEPPTASGSPGAPPAGPAASSPVGRPTTGAARAAPPAATTGRAAPTTRTGAPQTAVRPPRGAITGLDGKCVAVTGDGVQLAGCTGGPGQTWTIAGDGTIRAGSGCLHADGHNQAPTQLRPCDGSAAQRWYRRGDGSVQHGAQWRCLDAEGFDSADGTRVIVWDCNGQENQRWRLPS
jgi:hypothetical protein